jgi:hypothetical protein
MVPMPKNANEAIGRLAAAERQFGGSLSVGGPDCGKSA